MGPYLTRTFIPAINNPLTCIVSSNVTHASPLDLNALPSPAAWAAMRCKVTASWFKKPETTVTFDVLGVRRCIIPGTYHMFVIWSGGALIDRLGDYLGRCIHLQDMLLLMFCSNHNSTDNVLKY